MSPIFQYDNYIIAIGLNINYKTLTFNITSIINMFVFHFTYITDKQNIRDSANLTKKVNETNYITNQ